MASININAPTKYDDSKLSPTPISDALISKKNNNSGTGHSSSQLLKEMSAAPKQHANRIQARDSIPGNVPTSRPSNTQAAIGQVNSSIPNLTLPNSASNPGNLPQDSFPRFNATDAINQSGNNSMPPDWANQLIKNATTPNNTTDPFGIKAAQDAVNTAAKEAQAWQIAGIVLGTVVPIVTIAGSFLLYKKLSGSLFPAKDGATNTTPTASTPQPDSPEEGKIEKEIGKTEEA